MHLTYRLNQDDINHLNRLTKHNEIEASIKSLPKRKAQDLRFTVEVYQTFEELTLILLKLFYERERKRTLRNSLYETGTVLIPKPDKDKKIEL
jgi:hypothetical protein